MSGIHPVSAALLVGFGIMVWIGLVVAVVSALRRWRRRRVELQTQPEVDLSYFYEVTRAFEEAAQRWAEEAAEKAAEEAAPAPAERTETAERHLRSVHAA